MVFLIANTIVFLQVYSEMINQMNVHVVAKSRRRQQTQRIFMPSQRFYNTNFPPLCLNLNLSRPQKFDISFYKFGHINAQEILILMPEYKVAGTELENLTKTLENLAKKLNTLQRL